jgi:RNA polymerase sigma-70 factor (ECF subfamily)
MPDAEMSEETLIRRVVGGETNLYGILAGRYDRYVYRVVRQIVGNRMDAEDIVQEAHVRALTYLHQFGWRSKFVTWLCHVATNEALSQLRRQRRTERLLDSDWSGSIFSSTTRDPESSVRAQEAREALRRAVAKLPPGYRTVFLLLEVRQATTREVAGCLGIRRENVRLRLHRARRLLRKTIGHDLQ